MLVSVVICTYNRHLSLQDTLESLIAQTADRETFEVIVVDNHSDDATRQTVQEMAGCANLNIRYLYEVRRGKAYALETGIQEAKGEILAFTDDDVIVDTKWIENIQKAFIGQRIACLGGRIRPLWLCEKPKWYDERFFGVIVEYDRGDQFMQIKTGVLPFGANLILSAEVPKKHGGFRQDLASASFMRSEDTEMCRRLLSNGEPVYYAPDVVVWHKVTAGRMIKSFFRNWFYTYGAARSRIGIPKESGHRKIFNVPRWRYRNAITTIFRAMGEGLKGRPSEAFYYETRFWRELGFIFDRWKTILGNRDA